MRNYLLQIKQLTIFVLLLITSHLIAQNIDVQRALQHRIEAGMEQGGLRVGDIYLFNQDSLIKYYAKRQFNPVWSDAKNQQDFITIIRGAYEEGLLPSDYHVDAIKALVKIIDSGNAGPGVYADLDLLMSDAISLYINHMNYGKVMQSELRKTWDLPENPMPDDPGVELEKALANNTLLDLINSFGPQHFMYKHLKNGLKKYRQIKEDGGWPVIPEGETLKKGMEDNRVPIIRKRLLVTGDLMTTESAEPNVFDEAVEQAVKQFQLRHNLNQDGVIGKNTLAQMNRSVDDRINQIRINMERARWIMHKLEDDFLVVNIAGFNIRRITDGEIVYFSPVIVGKPYHQSPVFKATMQYFVINPTWTVPYSIATRETLPKLQRNPNYLAEHNMIIMDRNGKKLDPATIDFNQYSRGNFPFTVRQEPGPHNALGEVKFIFPNPYSVYVHDTPGPQLI